MRSAKDTPGRASSQPRSDRLWRNTASRLRGYLDKRRLPYILEKEDETIVLWLHGAAARPTSGQSQACA